MNPSAAATPPLAPLHDIVGPIAFFPYPAWMVGAAGAALLLLLAGGAWFFFLRERRKFVPSPWQIACAELETLRGQVGSSDPHAFAVTVSDVLRDYLTRGLGLPATNQTSREFLETVRAGHDFNDDERVALAAFVEKTDLIKFARAHATAEDCGVLVDQADRLVRSRGPGAEAAPTAPVGKEEVLTK